MNANKSILDLYADLGDAVTAFDRAHTVEHYRAVLAEAREAAERKDAEATLEALDLLKPDARAQALRSAMLDIASFPANYRTR